MVFTKKNLGNIKGTLLVQPKFYKNEGQYGVTACLCFFMESEQLIFAVLFSYRKSKLRNTVKFCHFREKNNTYSL